MLSALLLLTLPALAANTLPEVRVDWKGELGSLMVLAPTGEHIAPDAPAAGWVEVDGQRLQLEGWGAGLQRGLGLTLPGDSAHVVQGALSLSLCENGGTTYRLVEVGFLGTVEGRKGAQLLSVSAPTEPVLPADEDTHAEAPHAEALGAEAAFAAAQADGRLVLLDFTAVWCPPCQLLAADVLHDPANALDLAPFVLAKVDADARESWDIKDRYGVGGYPTLIVARADGTELDRMVGYPGEAEFIAWLDATRAEGLLPLDELAGAAASMSAAEAGAAALRLARADRADEAKRLLERADEGVDARLARLALDPDDAQLAWLADNAPGRIYEWGFAAMSVPLEPATRASILAVVDRQVPRVSPAKGADLLYLRAKLGPPEQAEAWYGAAAALLASALTGDPVKDRGNYTFLADLYAEIGDAARGLSLLEGAIAAFPEEFTYHYAAAGLLQDQERYEEALPYAAAAVEFGYDDNRLRAVKRQAEIERAMGHAEEALALLDATLSAVELPDADTDVRTHRYVAQLQELREDIASGR